MITVSNLSKVFKSESGDVHAVKDASFAVNDGEFASIIGRSGSGKSTLLGLLGALDAPTNGSITVGDQDIATMRDRALIDYRCKKIGFVFQSYNLIPNLSALENVMLPMEFAGVPHNERRARAAKLLNQVGLDDDQINRRPALLSGGQQQRVSIARALANNPQLILADEPTGNLDSQTGEMIFDLLHSLAKSENTTIIAVTHDLEIAGKTDRTFMLQDGVMTKKR
ncbi:MAG: ABC transporter ATP-binding protein [Candidatus Saccharimonas sp.]